MKEKTHLMQTNNVNIYLAVCSGHPLGGCFRRERSVGAIDLIDWLIWLSTSSAAAIPWIIKTSDVKSTNVNGTLYSFYIVFWAIISISFSFLIIFLHKHWLKRCTDTSKHTLRKRHTALFVHRCECAGVTVRCGSEWRRLTPWPTWRRWAQSCSVQQPWRTTSSTQWMTTWRTPRRPTPPCPRASPCPLW